VSPHSPSLHREAFGRLDDGLGASLFDASEDCVKIVDLDGRLLAMNANGICLMEIDDFERLRGAPWQSLWPEQHGATIATAVAEAAAGRGSKFVADCPTAKGDPRSWEVVVWPVLDADRRPVRLVSISRDVTERLRIENERALLARELTHRIKNMFSVVDGVIALSVRTVDEAKPFAEALRRRLAGLGRAIAFVTPQETPEREAGGPRSLQGLLGVVLEPYGKMTGDGRQITVEGDDPPVAVSAITPLALVINELATNAMKYGALRAADGQIDLRIAVADDMLSMRWTEHGVASRPPPINKSDGFGSVLLDNAVVRQLGGSLSRDWAQGLVVDIRVPLARITG
jgi:two-component sensor histidine kinase